MRMAIMAAALLGACTSSAGQSGEAGATTQQQFDVGGFDRVLLAGSQDVIVAVGAAASVRAEGDSEAIERLDIRVENGELRIGSKRRSGWNMGGHRGRVTVHVTVPALRGAALAGSGDLRIDRVQAESFHASVAGSGNLDLGTIEVERARVSVAGSGNVHAAGSAARTEISVAGSGNVELADLASRSAEIRVMGSGNAAVRASEAARVTVMGSGDVTVSGGARCSVTKRGSGDVRCG